MSNISSRQGRTIGERRKIILRTVSILLALAIGMRGLIETLAHLGVHIVWN